MKDSLSAKFTSSIINPLNKFNAGARYSGIDGDVPCILALVVLHKPAITGLPAF